MSEDKKKKEKKKFNFTGYDPIEDPEEIIAKDTNQSRREAFQRAYRVIANIIPSYFMQKKKKNASSSGGGSAFSQSIVVTPEKVTLETKESAKEEKQEERERED